MNLTHIILDHGLASFNVLFPFGSLNCPSLSSDLHLIEHLVFRGHPTMQYDDLMSFFENEGGFVNATVEEVHTVFYGRIDARSVDRCIKILLECITQFSINYNDYINEINSIKAELKYTSISTHIISDVNRRVFSIAQENKYNFSDFEELIELEHRLFKIEYASIVVVCNRNLLDNFNRSSFPESMDRVQQISNIKKDRIILPKTGSLFLQAGRVGYSAYTSYQEAPSENGVDLIVQKVALTEGFTSLIRREIRKKYGFDPYRLFFYKNQIHEKANCSIIFTPDIIDSSMQNHAFIHEIIMKCSYSPDELKKISKKAISMIDLIFENVGRGAKYIYEYLPLDKCDKRQFNEIKTDLQQSAIPHNIETWLNSYSSHAHHVEIHSIEKTVLHKQSNV